MKSNAPIVAKSILMEHLGRFVQNVVMDGSSRFYH